MPIPLASLVTKRSRDLSNELGPVLALPSRPLAPLPLPQARQLLPTTDPSTMAPDPDNQLTFSPPSSPPKSKALSTAASPKHSRDASLQQILHQFDPLSPQRQPTDEEEDEPPVPPPKDKPSPTLMSPTKPEVPEKDHNTRSESSSRTSFTLKRRASILSIEKPPPAEPDQPFEFQRFLEQMRHKSADGVARYMKRHDNTAIIELIFAVSFRSLINDHGRFPSNRR